jgi:hypothetical protein
MMTAFGNTDLAGVLIEGEDDEGMPVGEEEEMPGDEEEEMPGDEEEEMPGDEEPY